VSTFWSAGRDFATGDDPVLCHLCGKDTSIAMISYHLFAAHGIDPDEIADAPIIDETGDDAA
jgi:hypothetical protein